MLRKINELYHETVNAGKKIAAIKISNIAYDHLQSELNNRKELPEWIDKIRIESNFQGVELVGDHLGEG